MSLVFLATSQIPAPIRVSALAIPFRHWQDFANV
jgi:hypothetical protein